MEPIYFLWKKILFFEEIGWDVIPFSMHHHDNESTPWESHFINEIEFGNKYSFFEKITLASKVIYSIEARKKIQNLINVVQPSVCHAHNIYHHISPSVLSVLNEREIPVFITLHDLKLACPAYTMLAHDGVCERCKCGHISNVIKHKCIKQSRVLSTVVYFEALLHKLLDSYMRNSVKLIAPSKFYINKFADWGFNHSKFIHIPNFVNIDSKIANNNVGSSFLYFGRLSPEKGLKTMLEAASLANVPIWIVGKGVMEQELKDLAEKLGVDSQFFGYLSGESLYEKIRQARSIVLPSEWYENAPLSILESYALAVPVIGAEIGGIPELIKEKETGLIFNSGSSESLAKAMISMSELSNSQVREMGHKGREWVLSDFTAELYRERLLDLYTEFGIK